MSLEVEVRLFASLRDHVPAEARGVVQLELEPGASVVDVIEHFGIEPRLAQMVLVNGVQISRRWEERVALELESGDTVSIFPPVAGG